MDASTWGITTFRGIRDHGGTLYCYDCNRPQRTGGGDPYRPVGHVEFDIYRVEVKACPQCYAARTGAPIETVGQSLQRLNDTR